MLAGRQPGERLLEVRSRWDRPGMERRFFKAGTQLELAAAHIAGKGEHVDVYAGVLLRDERAGGKAAVSQSHLLFVEIDSSDAHKHLLDAPMPPTAVVASGSEGHVHAYFALEQPVDAQACESGNRRLAAVVAGDRMSVDAARILRPPGTVNHKREPTPVRLELFEPARVYGYEQLVGHLADPKAAPAPATEPRPRSSAPAIGRADIDTLERLRAIPTAEYVEKLTGEVPNIDGKVRCPFHGNGQERTPSLHCFDDGCFHCFGCGKGGTIFHFAGGLWGVTPRGREFLKLRDDLAATFGITAPPATQRKPVAGRPLAAVIHKPLTAAHSGAER
jgi:hypothetical protein